MARRWPRRSVRRRREGFWVSAWRGHFVAAAPPPSAPVSRKPDRSRLNRTPAAGLALAPLPRPLWRRTDEATGEPVRRPTLDPVETAQPEGDGADPDQSDDPEGDVRRPLQSRRSADGLTLQDLLVRL